MLYLGKNTNPSNQFNEDRAQKLKIKLAMFKNFTKKKMEHVSFLKLNLDNTIKENTHLKDEVERL